TSTTCPTDAKRPAGTACTADANPCTLDQCDGSTNTCTHPAGNAGTLCRAAAEECDLAESSTGTTTSCPTDAFKTNGTACTDDGDLPGRCHHCRRHRLPRGAALVPYTTIFRSHEHHLPDRCQAAGRDGLHGRRQPLHPRSVRRHQRDLPAPGGERGRRVPRLG